MEITIGVVKPQYEIELKNALTEEGKLYIDEGKEDEWAELIRNAKFLDLTCIILASDIMKRLEKGESPEEADREILEKADVTGAVNYMVAQIVIKFNQRGKEFIKFQKEKGYL